MIKKDSYYKDSYYTARVKDLIRKAKAYDDIRAVIRSEMCTTSIVCAICDIIYNAEVSDASDNNRVRKE